MRIWILATLMVVMAVAGGARGEKLGSPPKMVELVEAKCVVVGKFVTEAGGKIGFKVERVLRGDAETAKAAAGTVTMRKEENGEIGVWVVSDGEGHSSRDGASYANGGQMAVWFFEAGRQTAREPLELEEGFGALLAGKEPGTFFDVMQPVDFDRYWAGLEKLFAERPAEVVAKLHAVMLDKESETGYRAARALEKTGTMEVEKLWGKWTELPVRDDVKGAMFKADRERAMGEIRKALAEAKTGRRIDELLYLIPYGTAEQYEMALPFLESADVEVRRVALGKVWDSFWSVNLEAETTEEGKKKLAARAKEVLPKLEAISAKETDAQCKQRVEMMLAKKAGVRWVERIPAESLHEPVEKYSDEAEAKSALALLKGGARGIEAASAGREIAARYMEEGLEDLKAATKTKGIYNTSTLYEAMGYVKSPWMFVQLLELGQKMEEGNDGLGPMIAAMGMQDDKGSLGAIKKMVAEKCPGNGPLETTGVWVSRAIEAVSDKDAAEYLKLLEGRIGSASKVAYLRALAVHGDAWAKQELLWAVSDPAKAVFLDKRWSDPQEAMWALLALDGADVTEVLKKETKKEWPERQVTGWWHRWDVDLENGAGKEKRGNLWSELARRDPQWLAGLALEKMKSPWCGARAVGADVFLKLTGRGEKFHWDDFAAERAEELKEIEAWWKEHAKESRETWALSYFAEKGLAVKKLDKEALPELAKGLGKEWVTHCLAVEQISVITGKYFYPFRREEFYPRMEAMTERVTGWLKARGYLAK